MFWRVGFEIAMAQLLNRRRQTLVSVLGVALGVGFFIATASIMRGSEEDFVDRLVNNQPHITIKDEFRNPAAQPLFLVYPEGAVSLAHTKPREYLRGIKNYAAKVEELSARPGVVAEAALTGQIIVRYANKDMSASVAGIEPEKEMQLTKVETDMKEGSLLRLRTTADGIVIGQGMATELGLHLDDLATVITPAGFVKPMKVVGIFYMGNLLLDEGQVYVLLKNAQVLLDKPFIANQIRIRLPDPNAAETVAAQLESRWSYRADSWQEVNRDILGLFVIRNAITYSIVGAIMVVASFGIFNIISTVVMEKRRDIAILMSMGFRSVDIERIFLIQGALVGMLGMVIGWAIALGLLQLLASIRFSIPGMTDRQGFVLDYGVAQFLVGGFFSLVSAIAAAWYPARKAATVRPVEIIRGRGMSVERPLLEARGVTRILPAIVPVTLVHDIDLVVEKGEFVSVTGPSGSGKSSLLYLLGLLDVPTSGEIFVDGIATSGLGADALAAIRLAKIGFVFQFHFLLPEFTVIENVMLPMRRLGALTMSEIEKRAGELLGDLDMADQAKKRPDQLSGGQRQRVAIARALANDPVLILADEPTGNLDSRNSKIVQEIFARLAREQGRTVIAVTHEESFARSTQRNVYLVDGHIARDERR